MDNSKVVLVVEDDASILELEQALVEDLFGLQTLAAADGIQAMQIAAERLPSLILLDIMLPGMSGLEVARQLRANIRTRHIPIIAVTASTVREQVIEAGCDDYVQKPFDVDVFLNKVLKYLLGHKPLAHSLVS